MHHDVHGAGDLELEGYLFALDTATGNELWRVPTRFGSPTSPAVVDEVVYVGGREFVHALDATTGAEHWRFETVVAPSSPIVVDGAVYFGNPELVRVGVEGV
jgi:outer membrane protein assembly factor BamB